MLFESKKPIFRAVAIVIILLFSLIYIHKSRNNITKARSAVQQEQESVKDLIRYILRIQAIEDDEHVIVALRDYVYRKTTVESGDFDYQDPVGHFLKLDANNVKMLCHGMAQTYVWLLSQYNIPARTVQLATEKFITGQDKYSTHVSVEVFDINRKKWIVSDPTFNTSFGCNNDENLLDFQELFDCKQKNGVINPVENGIIYLPGRRVHEYRLPYADFIFGIKASEIKSMRNSLELPHQGWLTEALRLYPDQ